MQAHRGFGNSGSNDESQWGVGNVMKKVAEQGSHILCGSAGSDEFVSPKEIFHEAVLLCVMHPINNGVMSFL